MPTRPSLPPLRPPLQPHEMTHEHLVLERRSGDADRAAAASRELERRESARHESMCTLVDRMVARMDTAAAARFGRCLA